VAQGLNLYDELMPITGAESIATSQALARQEVGRGRYCLPCHRTPSNSRNEVSDCAGSRGLRVPSIHCSPRHMMPFNSRNEGPIRVSVMPFDSRNERSKCVLMTWPATSARLCQEGIFTGISGGANMAGALRLAAKVPKVRPSRC